MLDISSLIVIMAIIILSSLYFVLEGSDDDVD